MTRQRTKIAKCGAYLRDNVVGDVAVDAVTVLLGLSHLACDEGAGDAGHRGSPRRSRKGIRRLRVKRVVRERNRRRAVHRHRHRALQINHYLVSEERQGRCAAEGNARRCRQTCHHSRSGPLCSRATKAQHKHGTESDYLIFALKCPVVFTAIRRFILTVSPPMAVSMTSLMTSRSMGQLF